ncbi:MAG: hypothetical protein KJ048_12605 [Dehalococcoidia bacterium]|nr:hypothetical protein [Dehalococcoidia bacterium]
MTATGRISIPRLPRRLIPRPRLLQRLHAAIGNGLTVIQAPAGYGKTTLIASFATEVEFHPAWLSLDASAGAPEVLAQQLAAALAGDREVEPPAVATKFSDLQAYLHAAARQAADESGLPLLVVIDNVEELADGREAGALLVWLMEVLPEGSEVILSGREVPFIPSINALIATGELTVLEAADLAFDQDELAAAIELSGAAANPGTIAQLTAGWPVAVMATLAGGAGSGDRLSAAAFDRYLQSEVWERVPSEVQDVLRRVALHPTIERAGVELDFSPAAWRQLTAWASTRDFLCEHLSPAEFRLNPMLRQFIVAEFQRADPEAYDDAVQHVLQSMIAAGDLNEAVEFARSAASERYLAEVLEAHSGQLIIQGAFTLLWRAFECISTTTLGRRPLLRALLARLTAHHGDPEEALRKANLVLRDPSNIGAPRVHALLATLRSLRLLGRLEEATSTAHQLRALECGDDLLLQTEVAYQSAEFELSITRNFVRAEELLNEAIRMSEHGHVEPLGLLARSTLGQALAMHGDAPAAVTVLTRAAQGWRSLGRSSNLGWVLNNLGMSHLQAGDFASAVSVLTEAIQEGIDCGNQRNVAYATASLGDAELALGHFQNAREHYEEAIRICATDALDETLASLSIAGLSAAFLGLGDLQQADFFSRRALLVALASANDYEVAHCKLQQAACEFAAGNYVSAVSEAAQAAERFEAMEVLPSLAIAHYRIAMAQFRANKRAEAQEEIGRSAAAIKEPWMASALVPLMRENPMFAQWAASRATAGRVFRDLLERQSFGVLAPAEEQAAVEPRGRLPRVVARSLGALSVSVGGRDVSDEQWASARAKEMFFLLLSHRSGLRKEEAVEHLYPDLPREKCNSAFHSNLYRIRKALYQDSVVKRDGAYLLNPEGQFDWDVEEFEAAIARGRGANPGSKDRALAFQEAVEKYAGPFAEVFQSEWAAATRARLEGEAHESLAMLAAYFASRDDYESAAMCMERVLRANQYNEEAAYQLARYRGKAGQTVQALRFIDDYGSTYASELGEQLPERFWRLRADIAAGVAV